MNLASWIILAIVIAVLALAVRATFFKKNKGGCCGCSSGDEPAPRDGGIDLGITFGCGDCTACSGCAAKSNCLQPTIKEL